MYSLIYNYLRALFVVITLSRARFYLLREGESRLSLHFLTENLRKVVKMHSKMHVQNGLRSMYRYNNNAVTLCTLSALWLHRPYGIDTR